ncbi:hypothetical protein [Thiolapillus sp.]|uniref:hypothetical protein n=1 Tax=Thiolapillus sp. TaxID=2017437 RepID=UPI003AF9431C
MYTVSAISPADRHGERSYRTPDKQCGPGRYRGLTAFASLSMAVSGGNTKHANLRSISP